MLPGAQSRADEESQDAVIQGGLRKAKF